MNTKNLYLKIFIISSALFGVWISRDFGIIAGTIGGMLFGLSNCALFYLDSQLAAKKNSPFSTLLKTVPIVGLPWAAGICWQLAHIEQMPILKAMLVGLIACLGFGFVFYGILLAGSKLRKDVTVSWRRIVFIIAASFGLYAALLFAMSFGVLAGLFFGALAIIIVLCLIGIAVLICKLIDKATNRSKRELL